MALHWTTFENRVRDLINEPQTGQIQQAKLVRWANECIEDLPVEVQQAKARVVIQFNNAIVTLLEEDWPGTEFVGVPTYAYGTEGAFYLKNGTDIDSIREIQQRQTGTDDCGDPVYAKDWSYPQLDLKRQEHIQNYHGVSNYPTHYGCYRKWLYTPRDPVDNPRPLTEPFDVLVVWFDGMFDYSAVDYFKYYEIQYRRRLPVIDLTMTLDACGDPVEYTQPYFYIPEQYDKLITYYVIMQALYALGDKRVQLAMQKYEDWKRKVKWHMANRGSVDRLPRLEDPDAGIITRSRRGGRGRDLWQW